MSTPRPTDIQLHQKSRVLEMTFDDGSHFELPCEYLRVYSPSAEVRGHGPGQEVLQLGKEDVNIVNIKPVGNYAVQFEFDDKHDTGIYSWQLLYDLGVNKQKYWQEYVDRLQAAGYQRREIEQL
ncbi:MAG: DUF971 domain-containing protein [Gammaproteobacteria bacterium]